MRVSFQWGSKQSMLIWVVVVSVLSDGVNGKANATETSVETERKLKLLNKPAVKSIQSEDGDIIDCVDIYKQPAFDHPALKNHTIQMKPSNAPAMENSKEKNRTSETVAVSQIWQKSGSCPNGTIPIRRVGKQDLLRANSLENFGRKSPQIMYTFSQTGRNGKIISSLNYTTTNLGTQENRSEAVLVTAGYNYLGASGDINVWNPKVASTGEFSTAQIWLVSGPGNDFESVEAGWMVNPLIYGDKVTRFFAYWTRDASNKTGCFDLLCSGFVQTNPKIALGASIHPISSTSGPQYVISIYIFMDEKTGNWWLQFGSLGNVGYWPGSLFSTLRHSATMVQWGGEVYSPDVKKAPHTSTAMGSGQFARDLFGYACFIKHVRIKDYSLSLKYPEWVAPWGDENYCYSPYNYQPGFMSEPVFYFGGPGQNPLCP